VHRAFDDLLATAGSVGVIEVPTDGGDKMSQLPMIRPSAPPRPPRRKAVLVRVVHALVHASNKHPPEDDPQPTQPQEKPRKWDAFRDGASRDRTGDLLLSKQISLSTRVSWCRVNTCKCGLSVGHGRT
jgi:hypothetical protein